MNTLAWRPEEISLLDPESDLGPLSSDMAPPTEHCVSARASASDDDLVDRAAAGDSAAFGLLLRRHDDKMRGVVWRVVGTQRAMDDILQDAYLKAWSSIGRFRREAAFSSWLYRIVYTTAIDAVRFRRPVDVLDDDTPADKVGDHASGVADSLGLRRALTGLSADHLAVLTLIDGAGHSYHEVAALLDISPGTVASRLHRARAELRIQLGGQQAQS